nr:class I SAM-dependent methyltransferase [Pseudomonadota bacterium]
SHALAQLGAKEVWACDAVPKQLWAAAQYGSQLQRWPGRAGVVGQGPCRYVVAEATSLPFVSGCFDLVVANLVLHHVRPVLAVLQEARRLLRPGGVFAAAEPAPLAGMLAHDATSENEAPLWPQVITDALTQAGFVDVRSEYYWSRFETSRLGVLSPSYRVRGQVPSAATAEALPEALVDDAAILSRPLLGTKIPGLLLDLGAQAASPGQPLSKQARLAQLQIGQIDQLAQLVASRVLRS